MSLSRDRIRKLADVLFTYLPTYKKDISPLPMEIGNLLPETESKDFGRELDFTDTKTHKRSACRAVPPNLGWHLPLQTLMKYRLTTQATHLSSY